MNDLINADGTKMFSTPLVVSSHQRLQLLIALMPHRKWAVWTWHTRGLDGWDRPDGWYWTTPNQMEQFHWKWEEDYVYKLTEYDDPNTICNCMPSYIPESACGLEP